MVIVSLKNCEIDTVYKIVGELRTQGLRQGQDFDFSYNPPTFDDTFNDEEIGFFWRPASVDFKFYQDNLATMFSLRYAGKK